jgi:post-segregation antitoxin (ccd killing protein)
MSYDFAMKVDTGGDEPHYIEPYFDDQHPILGVDGHAGNVMVTNQGYARCGNYTSNVSGMWTRCLTAACEKFSEAKKWMGDDARAFNATGRYVLSWKDGEWVKGQLQVNDNKLYLRDLENKTGAELASLLKEAIEWAVEHLDELREMNPSNGWGNAEGAVTYLWDIQRMCEMHPKARLYLSS